MRVGIIGANGQVGTELCFLFREWGTDIVPIVRTPLAAATFDHHGFDYRVADVAGDPSPPIGDLDVVVNAAFAPYVSRGQYRVPEARRDNQRIVEHMVQNADSEATVIHFSSLAVFGRQIGRSPLWWYVHEKRRLERVFQQACDSYDVDGYTLRLGHVFGVNQGITEKIRERLADTSEVRIRADPEGASNAVHTVTVREAIRQCARENGAGRADPGTYSVVNSPQWTWGDIVDYYADTDTNIQFDPVVQDGGGVSSLLTGLVLQVAWSVPLKFDELLTFARFLPDKIARYLYEATQRRYRPSEIKSFQRRFDFHRQEFDYDPVPGPFLPGLSVSRESIAATENEIPAVL